MSVITGSGAGTTWTIVVSALFSLLLAGCVGPAVIHMKNPRTDQVYACTDVGRPFYPQGMGARECAQALERDGWVRLTPK